MEDVISNLWKKIDKQYLKAFFLEYMRNKIRKNVLPTLICQAIKHVLPRDYNISSNLSIDIQDLYIID